MLTVVILDNGEPNVVSYTFENLWRELKDIPDAKLVVSNDWFSVVPNIKNNYVCFVEADCLVSSGYFSSQLGLFKKNAMFRKLAMLASATGVNNWANRFYGYTLDSKMGCIVPNRDKKSSSVYPVQIAYVPGAIIRMSMLKRALDKLDPITSDDNLVKLSVELSLAFWQQGDGNRVHVNPNPTYVTTEGYVNDTIKLPEYPAKLKEMFSKESI